jgi:putative redox protein
MKANLKLDRNMRIIGTNEKGLETIFDTSPKVGGEDTAPTPMEIMLQSVAACSFADRYRRRKNRRASKSF